MTALYGFWHGMAGHLWQTTIVIGLVLAIQALLRGAPSRASHALWSAALVKIFLPLSLFGGAANLLFRAVFGGAPAWGRGEAPQLLPAVAAILDPIGSPAARAPGSMLSSALVAATACWASSALYLLGRLVVDTVRAGRHGGTPFAALDGSVSGGLRSILDGSGVPLDRVILCDRGVMPTVVGLIRPMILVPGRLVRELNDDELRAIVLHEDAHRRRRDPLRAALQRLGLALFFFYPPLYLVLRRLRSTAEYACDENVVQAGVPALTYARALARTLSLGLASPAYALAAASGTSLLRRRLERLPELNRRRYAMRFEHRALVAAAALVVAAATFYPLPMKATPDREKGAAQKTAKESSATVTVTGDKGTITAKVEIARMTQPRYPEEARKLGVSSEVHLRLKIAGAEGGGIVVAASVDSLTLTPPEGAAVDRDTMKKLQAQFEKNALEAAGTWTFNVDASVGKADTIEVIIPVTYKLH